MSILKAIKTWVENIQKEMSRHGRVKGRLVYVLHIPHTWTGVKELAAREGYTLRDDVFSKYYKYNIEAWQETGDEHFIKEYITWRKENE